MHLSFKERPYNTVEVKEKWGRIKTFRIPTDLTVEEVERFLELADKYEEISKRPLNTTDFKENFVNLKEFWEVLVAQVTIILQHYQPEITIDYVRKYVTQQQLLDISQFHKVSRFFQEEEVKKKISSREQLEALRGVMVLMIYKGFQLGDLKKLYIDELNEYYAQLIRLLEDTGEMKKGASDKIRGVDKSSQNLKQFAKLWQTKQ